MRTFLSLLTIAALSSQVFFAYVWGRPDITELFLGIHNTFNDGAPEWVRMAFSLNYYWLVFTSLFSLALLYVLTQGKSNSYLSAVAVISISLSLSMLYVMYPLHVMAQFSV